MSRSLVAIEMCSEDVTGFFAKKRDNTFHVGFLSLWSSEVGLGDVTQRGGGEGVKLSSSSARSFFVVHTLGLS